MALCFGSTNDATFVGYPKVAANISSKYECRIEVTPDNTNTLAKEIGTV